MRPEEQKSLLAQKCPLCHRDRPVFAGDEQLHRLPERSLTPFLRLLKKDVSENVPYLKMLKLNQKFIRACACSQQVHSYCQTVQTLQQKQVYCKKCDSHYNLHIYNQNQSVQSTLYKWLAILTLAFCLAFLFALLDAQLKANHYNSRLAKGSLPESEGLGG